MRLKRGSVCQKLLELEPDDIVDIVFKINPIESRTFSKYPECTNIRCTDDLAKLTEDDNLAFMAAAIEDENEENEQQFCLINGEENADNPVQRQEDYSLLGFFIAAPELYEDDE